MQTHHSTRRLRPESPTLHTPLSGPQACQATFQAKRPRVHALGRPARLPDRYSPPHSPERPAEHAAPPARALDERTPREATAADPASASLEAFRRRLQSMARDRSGSAKAVVSLAMAVTQARGAALGPQDLDNLLAALMRAGAGRGTAPCRLETRQLEFLAGQVDAQRPLQGSSLRKLMRVVPQLAGTRNAEGLRIMVAALDRALATDRLPLSSEDALGILRNIEEWPRLPAQAEVDAMLQRLATHLRAAQDGIRVDRQRLHVLMQAANLFAPRPFARVIVDIVCNLLENGRCETGDRNEDSIVCSATYVAMRLGHCPELRRLLAALAPRIREAQPASHAPGMSKTCRNLHYLPRCVETDAFLHAITPWIRNASCRLGYRSLLGLIDGFNVQASPVTFRVLGGAITSALRRAEWSEVHRELRGRVMTRLARLPTICRNPNMGRLCIHLLDTMPGPLTRLDVSCAAICARAFPYDAELRAFSRIILRGLEGLPDDVPETDNSLVTAVLRAVAFLNGDATVSAIGVHAARLVRRAHTPAMENQWTVWVQALRGMGRTAGALALAGALRTRLRDDRLEQSVICLSSALHCCIGIADTPLARDVLDLALPRLPTGDMGLVHAVLVAWPFAERTEGAASMLEVACARITALEEAGQLSDMEVVKLVRAITLADPHHPLPACLVARYEAACEAVRMQGPSHAKETALNDALRARLQALAVDLELPEGALSVEFGAVHRGIEMDAILVKLGINIEWDGILHRSPIARVEDPQRDAFLRSQGIEVIRIRHGDDRARFDAEALVQQALEAVLERLNARVTAARQGLAGLQAQAQARAEVAGPAGATAAAAGPATDIRRTRPSRWQPVKGEAIEGS